MGTNEYSQPASKSSWDSQDFGDISMVLKMANFRKSTGPRWVNDIKIWLESGWSFFPQTCIISQIMMIYGVFDEFWKITHLSLI